MRKPDARTERGKSGDDEREREKRRKKNRRNESTTGRDRAEKNTEKGIPRGRRVKGLNEGWGMANVGRPNRQYGRQRAREAPPGNIFLFSPRSSFPTVVSLLTSDRLG